MGQKGTSDGQDHLMNLSNLPFLTVAVSPELGNVQLAAVKLKKAREN